MKVRVYSPFFPYPPNEGAFSVIFDQVRALGALGAKVELAYWRGEHRLMPARAEQNELARLGHESAVARAWRVGRSLASPLSSTETFHYPPSLARARLDPADWGIYHFSFAYAWLRQGARPEARTAVVYHNLESDLARLRGGGLHSLNAGKLARHEVELAGLADELWFLSPRDLEAFQARVPKPEARIRLVPPTFSAELARARLARFAQARREPSASASAVAGFAGGLHFGPNRESVDWILRKLAPILARRGFRGELRIAGRGADRGLLSQAEPYPFVRFLGFVADLEPFWASLSHALVPHVSGSGVRIKLVESLVSGIPSFATQEAAARLHPELQRHPLLHASDDAEVWAAALLSPEPYSEREKAETAVAAGPWADFWEGERLYKFLFA